MGLNYSFSICSKGGHSNTDSIKIFVRNNQNLHFCSKKITFRNVFIQKNLTKGLFQV